MGNQIHHLLNALEQRLRACHDNARLLPGIPRDFANYLNIRENQADLLSESGAVVYKTDGRAYLFLEGPLLSLLVDQRP